MQDGNGDRRKDGAGTRTETRVKSCGRTQGGNGDGSGGGNESSSGDGNGNGDGIEEVRGEAKRRKKQHTNCRYNVGKCGELGGKQKNVDKKVLVQ